MIATTGLAAGCGTPAPSSSSGASTTTATAIPLKSIIPKYLATVWHVHDNLAHSVIVDARPAADYAAGHIPGAINVAWQAFSQVDTGTAGDPGWGTLKSPSELAAIFSRLGFDKNKQILVYASPVSWGADGRILWMLRLAGFDNSLMLDGGYKAWTDAGYPASTDVAKPTPLSAAVGPLDQTLRTTTSKLSPVIASVKLLDVRSGKEFAGLLGPGMKRGGRIPGAVNIPFESWFKADGTLKSIADLVAALQAAAITRDSDIVVYSTDGVSSAYVTLVLDGIGYKVRNYDGSFIEWAGNATLPVVK
jgi:thiosulfate/3-mercaptopyruvate sulfurtransferase